MKIKKNNIIFTLCISTMLGIIVGILNLNNYNLDNHNTELYNNLPVTRAHGMKMYDTSTPEKAIGISDYVFVAKINKILRTEYKNQIQIKDDNKVKTISSDPYTIYEIEVLDNIKGYLKTNEPIEFMQYGGLNEDGKSYIFMDNGELLNEGEYYILMADIWKSQHGETIEASETDRIIQLGSSYNATVRNGLISEYKRAFMHQEIPSNKNITNNLSKYDINYIE